ncbi:MAG: tetratricopeptide repeat protein [Kouleothrix sp.]|jgi:tetratricopeptide (TPR) repeat protein|nr:tetratricopeptide repeat protein [Kouleothrix sp.]
MSDPSTWPTDFDALWNYDQPAESEQQFRALLPVAERSGDHGYLAELLSQIARAEGLQHKFDAAHTTLDRAAALIGARPSRAGVRYLLERGRVFNSAQQLPQAHVLFSEAWELAQALYEDGYAVDAAHMLAIVAPPEQKLAWEQRALALAEQSAQPRARGWLGSLYNNIGWSYHALGQHEQALAMFERALDARTAAGDAQAIHIARWCVARGLRALGRHTEALAAQQALQHTLDARGASDGYVYEELGENLLALGQAEAARPYFARAYTELAQDPWLAESEPERLARLQALGTNA